MQNQPIKTLVVVVGILLFGLASALATGWTEVFSNSASFSTVTRLPDEFVSITGSSIARSSDGTNWTVQPANMEIDSWCMSSNGAYLGVSEISNAVWAVASSNLTTWSAQGEVRYIGPNTFRSSEIVASATQSLCTILVQPSGWGGSLQRYLYSASWPFDLWQEPASNLSGLTDLSRQSGKFYGIGSPELLHTCVYESLDGEAWTRLSPLWIPLEAFTVSLSVSAYSAYKDLVLSVHGEFFGGDLMGVFVPLHDDFLPLPPGPENSPGHDTIHYDGQRIAAAGSQYLYSGETEYFIVWSDDFAATWQKQLLPVQVTGFASSEDATIAVGAGRFFHLAKATVQTAGLLPVSLTGVAGHPSETNISVSLAVETGGVYQLEVSTNLLDEAWSSAGLPFVGTNEMCTVSLSGITNSPCFIRGKTLFMLEED